MKTIIELAKELEFNSEVEYFDYLVDCYICGNFTSCENLFNEFEKEDKKVFLNYLNGQAQYNGYLQARNFYFNLL